MKNVIMYIFGYSFGSLNANYTSGGNKTGLGA